LFVSGALLSLDRPVLQAVLRIHHWAPWLAVGAVTASAYLIYLTVGSEA
jgi:hypothetical protein